MDETTSRSEQRQVNYSTQFLHPYYYFFFPQSSELIKMVNNEEKAPWIDKRGYGGGVGQRKRGTEISISDWRIDCIWRWCK